MAATHVAVLGSLNADLVTRLRAFPRPGETVVAEGFAVYPGGKGANQAVACGRLGAAVAMYGKVGDDELGARLRASLAGAGVGLAALGSSAGVPTGTASIWVDGAGENMIAIAAGANGLVDPAYVDEHLAAIAAAEVLLLQLEIPLATLAHLLGSLPATGGPRVLLDPAPARPLDDVPLERVDLLTPNEHELRVLTGLPTATADEVRAASRALMERRGVRAVLTKAGARGAYLARGERFDHAAAFAVDALDTTAAGDAFNGALAAALTEGAGLVEAMGFANAAAALSVTRAGAQPAMPSRAEVDAFLRRAGGGAG